MPTATSQPVPKDLRAQMIKRLETAPDADVMIVHEALLHAEKLRLMEAVSRDAEEEQAEGKWENLPEIIRQVRAKLRRE